MQKTETETETTLSFDKYETHPNEVLAVKFDGTHNSAEQIINLLRATLGQMSGGMHYENHGRMGYTLVLNECVTQRHVPRDNWIVVVNDSIFAMSETRFRDTYRPRSIFTSIP